jgi:hypothetical protein
MIPNLPHNNLFQSIMKFPSFAGLLGVEKKENFDKKILHSRFVILLK